MKEASKVRKIAFVGNHLPRKCGIATFTTDLLAAVATAHPQSHSFAVAMNDIKGGYDYPEVVRFEITELGRRDPTQRLSRCCGYWRRISLHTPMKSVVLCSALALPLILGGQERRDDPNRAQTSEGRRYEDSAHKTHEWNATEEDAYRRYLEEHHRKYHDFSKANKKEQNDYWKWRETHSDANRR